jgi:hypothetical protein
MRLRILPEVERDLEIGEDFYESQSPGWAPISSIASHLTLSH